jgi:retron-type reverse transcriptase
VRGCGEEAGEQKLDVMDKNLIRRHGARDKLASYSEVREGSKRLDVNGARISGKVSHLIRGGLSERTEVSRSHSSRGSNAPPGRLTKASYRAKGRTEEKWSRKEREAARTADIRKREPVVEGTLKVGEKRAGREAATGQMEEAGSTPYEEELWEQVFSRENLVRALERVEKNQGAPGIDGMTVEELREHLKVHWEGIRAKLDRGTYRPSPVKRVEIPKPGGGTRQLGIPTAVDRLIQQALAQVLGPLFEATFSDHSYGFRPGRSAHDAVKAAREHIEAGYTWVVDIDLERFFDTVNHDRLMAHMKRVVEDKRILRLVNDYLKAGVMVNGVVIDREEGTPQGSPLAPLLSNIVLTELDRKLEERGHRFVRYADDVRRRQAA